MVLPPYQLTIDFADTIMKTSFFPLDEAIVSRAAFVILYGADGRAEMLFGVR